MAPYACRLKRSRTLSQHCCGDGWLPHVGNGYVARVHQTNFFESDRNRNVPTTRILIVKDQRCDSTVWLRLSPDLNLLGGVFSIPLRAWWRHCLW